MTEEPPSARRPRCYLTSFSAPGARPGPHAAFSRPVQRLRPAPGLTWVPPVGCHRHRLGPHRGTAQMRGAAPRVCAGSCNKLPQDGWLTAYFRVGLSSSGGWEAEGSVLVGAELPGSRAVIFRLCLHTKHRVRDLFGSAIRTSVLFMRALPSWPHGHPPKDPTSEHHHLGDWDST